MTEGDSDAWRRTGGTTTRRLWAQGMRTMLAGNRELTHAGDETIRVAMAPWRHGIERRVAEVAPRGARSPTEEPSPTTEPDAFDEFLATFEPELPVSY